MTSKIITIFIIITVAILSSFSQEKMVLAGKYTGSNYFIQNPLTSLRKVFCTDSVYVNGKKIPDEISSLAYEIDLKPLNHRYGDSLRNIIFHRLDCTPKVLNTIVQPPGIARFSKINIDSTGVLKWETTRELYRVIFIIEHKKLNKWVKIGEEKSSGNITGNKYVQQVKLHTGKNIFRVKHMHPNGTAKISPETSIISKESKVNICINNEQKTISFSDSTYYEIFNNKGNIIRKGYSNKIDLLDLNSKAYFINYDDETAEIKLKDGKYFLK